MPSSFKTAAAMMLQGMTAQYLLRRTYKVKPGDTIVVHAAAGGVGLIMCQWAKHLGATVIGVVSTEEKAELARAHGAAHTVIGHDDLAAEVKRITGGAMVPVVYDSVGKDTFTASLDCLAPLGLMVSYGNASGPVPPVDIGMLAAKGSLYLTRPSLATYTAKRADLEATAADLFDVVRKGAVKIQVNQTFPLSDAAAAHIALEAPQDHRQHGAAALDERRLDISSVDTSRDGSRRPDSAAARGKDATATPARVRRGTSGRTRLTAVIVACALFMQNLDSTVIATALPTMARAFGADPVHMNVALTSYLLSLAVFIPASGWMADRYGTRTVFRAAIVVFTRRLDRRAACADTLGFLVLARILQGHRRRHDGAGRAAGAAAHRAEARAGGGDGLADHAGADRPGGRPAGRRLHRHLLLVALDLLHQRADRRAGHRAGHAVRRGRTRTAARRLRCFWAWCCPASRCPA